MIRLERAPPRRDGDRWATPMGVWRAAAAHPEPLLGTATTRRQAGSAARGDATVLKLAGDAVHGPGFVSLPVIGGASRGGRCLQPAGC